MCLTRVSNRFLGLMAGLGLAVSVQICVPDYTGNIAHAFDPEKVFKEEKPSLKKLFRFYLKKKREGDDAEALGALEYAAGRGNQTARWKLGKMYEAGDTVPKNPAKAFRFFKDIVDKYGEARPNTPEWEITAKAMVALGHYYQKGVPSAGIKKNRNEARVMFTTAAMYFRDPDAQFELGRMLLKDNQRSKKGLRPEEGRRAVRMLKLAHNKGHVGAQALLGHALVEGVHLRQDIVLGLTMLTLASEKASPARRPWIAKLQQRAFALASVEQRRSAIAAVQKQ